ncbi:MAG: hypothetical protein LAP85_15755, partial [Acidobacteriia bacterium]|nr:hypothetical protein [Terriglobia bacterium]
FVVSFVHLECAPFGCISYMLIPIITNNEAHSRVVSAFLAKNHTGLGTSGRPQGGCGRFTVLLG